MVFSKNWDTIYNANQQLSVWPWSDLVSTVMRSIELEERPRILELGCGAGANIPFFNSLNVDYFGIDGSVTAIDRLKLRFPEKSKQLRACDFTQNLYFDGPFDLIVDRGSLTHNSDSDIRKTVDLAFNALRNEGKLISIHWFSSQHPSITTGQPGEDPYTRINILTGPLAGTGIVHFSDKENIMDIFSKWIIENLDHQTRTQALPGYDNLDATWNIIAKRG
jgi:SAM-dependent methyltransferase